MSVTVEMEYLDWAENMAYGQNLLDLPEKVQENIESYVDGMELSTTHPLNPDNLYANLLYILSAKEVAEEAGLISDGDDDVDFAELKEDIISFIEDNHTYLGEDGDTYYYLQ